MGNCPSDVRTGSGAAIMRHMASIAPDPVTAPTTRSVIVRFAAGTLVAIAIAVVGGYFVLRAVAIDEAKRQRTSA